MLDQETLIENAVQASIDAGLAVDGQHGVAAARYAARFMFGAIQAAQPAVTDTDALAYRFWSVHPREIDAYLVNHPMPKGYKGGGRAWFFACEMRAVLSAHPCTTSPVVDHETANVSDKPVAWIRAGFLEELHREGTHSGVSTVLWLNETNPRKRHSKRIPLYTAPQGAIHDE